VKFYRAYHVDFADTTVGHMNFQAENDQAACINADTIKNIGKWTAVELWANTKHIECPEDLSSQRQRGP
jgi:hypothetical protein